MKTKKLWKILLAAFLAVSVIVTALIGAFACNKGTESRREDAHQMLGAYGDKISVQMGQALNYGDNLAEHAVMHPGENEWFPEATSTLMQNPGVVMAALITDNTVTNVMPQEAEAAMLGRSINSLPSAYSLARVTNKLVVDGPTDVTVAGEALPVFLFVQPFSTTDGAFSGEAVVALDSAYVLEQLDADYLQRQGYNYEIWRVDPDSGRKSVIITNQPTMDFSDGVRATLSSPSDWTIAIIPQGGWLKTEEIVLVIAMCLGILILLAALDYSAYSATVREVSLRHAENIDGNSGLYNRWGFTKELNLWIGENATFSLCYFVYEGFNRFVQTMDPDEAREFIRGISEKVDKHVEAPHLLGRVGEGNYILAVREAMTPEKMNDMAKGISIELLLRVVQNGERQFLSPRYEYIIDCKCATAQGAMKQIVESYYKRQYGHSFIKRMTEKCRRLMAGETDVTFEECPDPELMELSKAFNQYAKRVDQIAYNDPIFHVGNRLKVLRDANMLIAYDAKRSFRIFCVDICDFSQYNDLFSNQAGDAILGEVIRRLTQVFGPHLYRINGDVFLGISMTGEDELLLASRLQNILTAPVQIDTSLFDLSVRISVCSYPIDGATPELLLDRVQSAMRYAKSAGEHIVLYNTRLREALQTEADIILHLRQAIADNTLEVWYQPIRALEKKTFVAAEALVRLPGEGGGYYPAGQVVELAERSGLAESMGEYVLKKACLFMKEKGMALGLSSITVNLSVQQLVTRNSSRHLIQLIKSTGLDPHNVVLEITESMLMRSLETASVILEQLREQGVRVALDDFGVGYSSLNYLSSLPVDVLKISHSLTQQIISDEKQRTLMDAITRLAEINGLALVVEGIETKEELDMVSDIGVPNIQGYYFARPMPEKTVIPFLETNNHKQ